MNKLIISLASTFFLTAAGAALAQEADDSPGKKQHRQHHDKHKMAARQSGSPVEQLTRALRKLGLEDEQKASIKVVFKQLREDIRPIMEESKAGQRQLRELTMSRSFDATAATVLTTREGELTAQRMLLTSQAMADALGYLTDEQRDQLEAMKAERKQRGEKRKEHKQGI